MMNKTRDRDDDKSQKDDSTKPTSNQPPEKPNNKKDIQEHPENQNTG